MTISLDDDLRSLTDSVVGQVTHLMQRNASDARLWDVAGAAGWIGIGVPERLGGAELPPLGLLAVARALGKSGIFSYFADSAATATVLTDLMEQSQAELEAAADLVRLVCSGHAQVALAGSGDQPRSRPARHVTPDVRLASIAAGRLFSNSGTEDPAFAPARLSLGDGAVQVVGAGRGTEISAMDQATGGRLTALRDLVLCAQIIGAEQYVFSLAAEFAKQRVQFGKPIAQFQGLRHVLVDLFSWLEAGDLMLEAAFDSYSSESFSIQSHAAIFWIRDRAFWGLQRGYEVLGGVGFMDEHVINQLMREIVVALAAIGSAELHAIELAGSVVPGHWK
jgi:alkylation response protein AidB-like acyl-CoA dehydrogenase